jgi:hypothetical protein
MTVVGGQTMKDDCFVLSNLRRLSRIVVALLFVLVVAKSEAADTKIENIQKDFIGSWIVDVDGEKRTRTLNIKRAEQKRDGVWTLDATYGWTDGGQTAVSVELIAKPEGYRLQLTTQANSLISADYSGTALFTGTFTWSSGKVRPVRLERLSAEEISERAANLRVSRMRSAIKLPGPDVPAECAALVGGWTGHWGIHGGEQWLWVVQVDTNCVAKYQIGRTGYGGPFETAQIRKGVLSTAGALNGTIYWERHGDELWAHYWGPGGITTSAVHKKIQIETK